MAEIVVTDGMASEAVELLQKAGHVVTLEHISEDDLLGGKLSNYEAIIIRSATKLTGEIIEASEGLRVIARAGVGVDNIDIEAAGRRGIPVINAPNSSTQSVVELTIGHLLSSVRYLPRSDRGLRNGRWLKKELKGTELCGKRLGLIGFGRIAQGVANVAKALGMEIHTYDPYLPNKVAKMFDAYVHKSVDSLFKTCTHISIHCNLTPETYHLVNEKRISLMPGKVGNIVCGNHIVNCARGGIVDESAVLQSLENGNLTSAALDVFEIEPVPENYDLLNHENFHGTPHIGAATLEAQSRVGLDTANNVIKFFKNKKLESIVNQKFLNL